MHVTDGAQPRTNRAVRVRKDTKAVGGAHNKRKKCLSHPSL